MFQITPMVMDVGTSIAIGLAVPLLFWFFDLCTKFLAAMSTEDVGCDLCLLGLSFGLTTIAPEAARLGESHFRQEVITFGVLSAAASLAAYMITLIVIAPDHPGRTLPNLVAWIRGLAWRVELTVGIGFLLVAAEIASFILLIEKRS